MSMRSLMWTRCISKASSSCFSWATSIATTRCSSFVQLMRPRISWLAFTTMSSVSRVASSEPRGGAEEELGEGSAAAGGEDITWEGERSRTSGTADNERGCFTSACRQQCIHAQQFMMETSDQQGMDAIDVPPSRPGVLYTFLKLSSIHLCPAGAPIEASTKESGDESENRGTVRSREGTCGRKPARGQNGS